MSRTNVYGKVTRDDGRTVAIGGRGALDRLRVWLNTDNAGGTNCSVSVRAEVGGRGLRAADRRRKSIGDDRHTTFTIELPEPNPHCTVELVTAGAQMRQLVYAGAALLAVDAAQRAASGDVDGAVKRIRFSRETLADMEARERDNYPNVLLPGGVSLARALAAVRMIDAMANGHSQ